MRRPVFALVVFLGLLPAAGLRAQSPEEQVEAYVQVIKAEQAEKSGNASEALAHYREALDLYRTIKNEFPDWRPDLISYRISDTLNQVKRLERETGAEEKASEPADDTGTNPVDDEAAAIREKYDQLRAEYNRRGREYDEMKRRVARLEAEQRAAPETNAQSDAPDRADEIAGLEQRVQDLSIRNRDLEAAQAKILSQIDALESQNEDLKNELAAQPPVDPQADAAAAELRSRIGELEATNAELAAGLQEAQQELAMAQGRSVSSGDDEALRLERDRLALEVNALKETVDLNFEEMARVHEYKKEIKSLKKANRDLSRDLEELGDEMRKNDLSEEYAAANQRIAEQEAAIASLNEQLETQEEALSHLQKEQEKVERARDDLEEKFEKASVKYKKQDDEIDALRKDLKSATKEAGSLQKDIESKEEEIDKLKAELEKESGRSRALKEEVEALDKRAADAEKQVKAAAKESSSTATLNDGLMKDNALLTSQNEVLVEEVQTFRKRLEDAEKKVRTLERELAR